MLKIKDLSKLKITKVKLWAMYFDYDGEKYLLHGSAEGYEYTITLYKRTPLNDKGKYDLECIESEWWSTNCIYEFLEPKKYGCYRDINKEYFIKRLTYYGFCCGIYDEYVKNLKLKIDVINGEIKMFEDSIKGLQESKRELLESKER